MRGFFILGMSLVLLLLTGAWTGIIQQQIMNRQLQPQIIANSLTNCRNQLRQLAYQLQQPPTQQDIDADKGLAEMRCQITLESAEPFRWSVPLAHTLWNSQVSLLTGGKVEKKRWFMTEPTLLLP